MFSLMMTSRKRHKFQAIPVCRKREGDSVSFIAPSHKFSWSRDDLIYVRCAGVTDLGAADDNTLARFAVYSDTVHICLDHMQEHIRIRLLMSTFIFGISASFYIRLCTVTNQIIFLAILQVFVESLMIMGACGLIAVIRYNSDSV